MRRTLTVSLLGTAFVLAGLSPAGAAPTEGDSPERPKSRRFHLECQLERLETGPAVACDWTRLSSAATYRLARAERGEPREIIHRGDDIRFVDTDVALGHKYAYRVQALHKEPRRNPWSFLGRAGRWSNVAIVKVAGPPAQRPAKPLPIDLGKPADRPEPKPADRPEPKPVERPEPKPADRPEPRPADRPEPRPADRPVELMKLACRPLLLDGSPVAVCEWSSSSSEHAAGYRLWRAGRDEARHVVFESRTETRFTDHEVRPGATYAYAVTAVDAGGRVIGHSETVWLKVGPPEAETRVERTSSR